MGANPSIAPDPSTTSSSFRQDAPVLASAQFRVTPADLTAAQRKYLRWTFSRLRLWIAVLAILAVVAVLAALAGSGSPRGFTLVPVVFGAAAALMIPAGTYLALPLLARRAYRRQPSLRHDFRVDLSDSGIRAVTPTIDSFMAWSDYVAWSQDSSVLLLWQSQRLFQLIPAQGLDPAFIEVFHRLVTGLPRR